MDDTPASTSDDAPSLKGHGNQIAKLAFVFLMGVTVTAVGLTLSNRVRPAPIEILAPAPLPTGAPSATPGLIRVYVSGEVVAPAVYQLSPDSIVEAAVRAAGGFTDEANTAAVNLAQPLADGAQIYIPSHGEVVASPEGILLMPVPSTSDNDPPTVSRPININTATQAELEKLPGIGPTLAQRIILHRESYGPFERTQAIMEVAGIGEGRYAQIQELITIGGEAGFRP